MSESAFDAAESATFVVDMEGHVVRWNKAAAALTAISENEIRSRSFQEAVLFPGDGHRWTRVFGRISAGLAPGYFESRWKIHDGSLVYLTCSCSVIRDYAGKAQYILCTVTDSLSREFMIDRSAELRSMSRFLHDTISQDLVALSYHVSYLETQTMDQPAQSHLKSALDLIDSCCRYVRAMSFMLAPPSPPETALEACIEQYTEYLREETGLEVTAILDPALRALPPEAESLLFAAVQKWVAQGIRTRRQPRISVRLRNRGGETILELEMVPPVPIVAVGGWTLIRERVRALGGEFAMGGDSKCVTANMSFPNELTHHENG